MNESSLHPLRDATLPIALAASLVAHVAVFTALGRTGGAPSPGAHSPSAVAPPLEARLVNPPVADVAAVRPEPEGAQSGPVPVDAASASAGDVAMVAPMPRAEPLPAAPVAARSMPSVKSGLGELAATQGPHVMLDADVSRARFGGTFDNGALDEFPNEVDAAVGVPDRIEVPYPPVALAAGQAATVLAWAVITEDGAVESTHVVEGPPEFADAVESTLARTRFIPARNGGANVRFYVMLAFEFRIDTGGTVAVDEARR